MAEFNYWCEYRGVGAHRFDNHPLPTTLMNTSAWAASPEHEAEFRPANREPVAKFYVAESAFDDERRAEDVGSHILDTFGERRAVLSKINLKGLTPNSRKVGTFRGVSIDEKYARQDRCWELRMRRIAKRSAAALGLLSHTRSRGPGQSFQDGGEVLFVCPSYEYALVQTIIALDV